MTDPNEIAELVRRHLTGEVSCDPLPDGSHRIGCLTPLDDPSGDGIVVWLEPHGPEFAITDYGEALGAAAARPPQDQAALSEQAADIARAHGLSFADGRLIARADVSALAESVWNVAMAYSRIAQVGASFRPHRQAKPRGFVTEVERDLQSRHLLFERQRKLEGRSGHTYTATFYVPQREVVIEPLDSGNWNQATSLYAKFGDLSRANGYSPYALLDDRGGPVGQDVQSLLMQVAAGVVVWSDRERWLGEIGLARPRP